jgi:hypothetical protein
VDLQNRFNDLVAEYFRRRAALDRTVDGLIDGRRPGVTSGL